MVAGTLTNNGTLTSQVGGSTNNYLRANVTNESGGQTVIASGELLQDQNTTTTNDGTLTVDASATLDLDTGNDVLDNTGTVSNPGTISLSSGATWQQTVTTGGPTDRQPRRPDERDAHRQRRRWRVPAARRLDAQRHDPHRPDRDRARQRGRR